LTQAPAKIRLDKWLWQARFFKTRGLSAKLVSGGHVRVNSAKVAKPAHAVGPGDVLTFPQSRRVRVIRILALGQRRGPAPEARALYDERFCRMWRYYLLACEMTFRYNRQVVFQFQLTKEQDAVPLTRDYLYSPDREKDLRHAAE